MGFDPKPRDLLPACLPTFADARGRVALESLVGVAGQLVRVAGGPDGVHGAHLAARAVRPLHQAALAGGATLRRGIGFSLLNAFIVIIIRRIPKQK